MYLLYLFWVLLTKEVLNITEGEYSKSLYFKFIDVKGRYWRLYLTKFVITMEFIEECIGEFISALLEALFDILDWRIQLIIFIFLVLILFIENLSKIHLFWVWDVVRYILRGKFRFYFEVFKNSFEMRSVTIWIFSVCSYGFEINLN